jgi:hypothetical protein
LRTIHSSLLRTSLEHDCGRCRLVDWDSSSAVQMISSFQSRCGTDLGCVRFRTLGTATCQMISSRYLPTIYRLCLLDTRIIIDLCLPMAGANVGWAPASKRQRRRQRKAKYMYRRHCIRLYRIRLSEQPQLRQGLFYKRSLTIGRRFTGMRVDDIISCNGGVRL